MRADTGEVYCAVANSEWVAPAITPRHSRAPSRHEHRHEKQENRTDFARVGRHWRGRESVRPDQTHSPNTRSTPSTRRMRRTQRHKDTNKALSVTLQPSRGAARLAKPVVAPPTRACGPARVARVAVWADADSSSVVERALISSADEDTKPDA